MESWYEDEHLYSHRWKDPSSISLYAKYSDCRCIEGKLDVHLSALDLRIRYLALLSLHGLNKSLQLYRHQVAKWWSVKRFFKG